ncbi:unnamed protein product [Adineta steineri]|uniref:Uncharacterized protein n=1 Tax=Adineta steineri TaxID=433720 RepID=A0A820DIZ7_9BILA|nr:unnamed protein product [Adineta steineri]
MDDDELLLDDHNVNESCVEDVNQQSIESLREWFLWSYLNVLFGSVILGLIAIGCSFRTHKFKQRKNYSKAYKWSYVTLFVNCTATLSGSVLIGYLIFTYFRSISKEEMQFMKNKLTTTHMYPS